jgi:methylmalonyl-CoA/ethylmalonyl-CoA epimerase
MARRSACPSCFALATLFFNCGGVRLMLEGGKDKIDVGTGVCHYFKVEHIEAVAADLKSRT